MEEDEQEETLEVLQAFRQGDVCSLSGHPDLLVVRASAGYIPLAAFREIFEYVTSIARQQPVSKIIFDKRSLTVFHQPSMEWYFLEWKEDMARYGVTRHRKLLPQDAAFREAARIGKEALYQNYPNRKFQELDIRYASSMREAIDS
jgi:hypothetical protein